jgi:glycosyltransferase involved in cell wall biosynthesis
MKRYAYLLQKKHGFDMIHCRSYLAADVGLSMKRKFGIKFLFDMRGFWADEKVDNGQWDQNNLLFRNVYRYYKRQEKKFLLKADAVVSLTDAAKSKINKNRLYSDLHIDVISCCADLEHFNYEKFDQQKINDQKKLLGISADQKIIAYLGSVGGWYMTREMFSFYKQLLAKDPSFLMLFLTKDDPSNVLNEAHAAGIPDNKIKVTYAERSVLPQYLSVCDCSIFFIRPTYSKVASSPTKHAELMSMGIPVICNDIGDTGNIVRNTGSGLIAERFTEEEYDRIINRIPELLSIKKEQIRKSAFRYFDLENGTNKYLEIYKRVLGS